MPAILSGPGPIACFIQARAVKSINWQDRLAPVENRILHKRKMMFTIVRLAGLGVCVATALVSLAAPAYAGEHKHEAQHAAPALKQGQKWVTDDVLRQGMNTIRQAMLANREAIEKERFSARDYQELAVTVNKEVANIVNNGKLSKEAAAAFHSIVLVELRQSTNLMQTAPKVQLRRAGAFAVLQALRNYGDYFQHPGWEIIR